MTELEMIGRMKKLSVALAFHAFNILAAASVLWLPIYLGELVSDIQWHSADRCTLASAACDKLRHSR